MYIRFDTYVTFISYRAAVCNRFKRHVSEVSRVLETMLQLMKEVAHYWPVLRVSSARVNLRALVCLQLARKRSVGANPFLMDRPWSNG